MMRTITINDGRNLPVRPVRPEDAPLLQDFHRGHSARTLYQRFFGHYPELSDSMAERFATVDGHDRLALVATDPLDDRKLVGVVRLDRDTGTTSAEYAAIVTDAWQGMGVGHGLTVHLLNDARDQGIDRVYALVLAGNQPMLALLKGLGLPWRTSMGNGYERVEIELDETWGEQQS
ncbi:MAG: GNAT family N-acetyltransferase [Thermomicrobiales bacterium]|nr:GNAT family N-acetyltransferase [Thermomicrobiales bacterium]